MMWGGAVVVASNGPVYTGPSLLVANRPQAPVRSGADAPLLLSHLRCLLPCGGTLGPWEIIVLPAAVPASFLLRPAPKFWRCCA